MKNISDLLGRFSRSLGRDVVAKEAIISCVKELCGFELSPESIFIKDDTVRIKASPAKKNEIRLHEEKLLTKLNERTGQRIAKILYN